MGKCKTQVGQGNDGVEEQGMRRGRGTGAGAFGSRGEVSQRPGRLATCDGQGTIQCCSSYRMV